MDRTKRLKIIRKLHEKIMERGYTNYAEFMEDLLLHGTNEEYEVAVEDVVFFSAYFDF